MTRGALWPTCVKQLKLLDRGRESRNGSPSLRTGRAGLPHPALQLVVLPQRGLTGLYMGCHQTHQPLLGEKGIGPAMMVGSSATAFASGSATQDAAQAHAYPAVES